MQNRPTQNRSPRKTIVFATTALLFFVEHTPARAQDQIEQLLQQGQIPANMTHQHGYSDFTDPLGKFLDLLAAGAFADARAIQPEACKTWLTTRQNSAFTGTFWIWNTQLNLDTLCAQP